MTLPKNLSATVSRRNMLAGSGGALAGAAILPMGQGALLAQGGSPEADLILENGKFHTQDPSMPMASAVAIRDGRIQRVGKAQDMADVRGGNTQVISLDGRTVIPGLNDSHQHPTRGGRFYASELRWDGLKSLEEGISRIAATAQRTPEGQWVRVIGGWSPYQFNERRMPTPGELTRAAPSTPVYVLFLYSQGFLNAAAVRELGISPATETPPGTSYDFTEDGGAIINATPNPELLYATIGALPPLSDQDQITSTLHYYRDLNRFGLTSVIDAGGGGHTFPDNYQASEYLAKNGNLSLRVSNYLFPQNKGEELAEFEQWTENWAAGVNQASALENGYVVEGGGEFLAWAAGDYENFLAGRPDITERANWRKQLVDVTTHLLQNQWPLRIHATYDESINNILNVFEDVHRSERAAGRLGFSGIRWAIDHAETAKPQTLRRIRQMGGGVAVQSRMAYAGEYFLERYGEAATRNAPPLRDMIAAGLPLGLGSDATRVASYNPWNTLYWATTGKSIGGTQLHDGRQRLTRQEALFHHTVGSAWFSQEDTVKGRMAPGQYADLAVLSDDYFAVPEEEIMDIESALTVVGGKPVYGKGEYASLMQRLPAIQPSWSPVLQYGGFEQ